MKNMFNILKSSYDKLNRDHMALQSKYIDVLEMLMKYKEQEEKMQEILDKAKDIGKPEK